MVMVFVVSPGAEGQRAGPGDVVVVARPGSAVHGAVRHRHRLIVGGRERDGEGEQRRLALPALLVQHVGDADARLVVQMVPSLKPRLMTPEVGPAGACLALRTPPAAGFSSSRTSSIFRLGEQPEHVVVAGRGVVAADVRVPGTHQAAIDVNPAADTLAVLPAGASGAARGLVAGNVHVVEGHGGKIEDAAAAPADAAAAARPAAAARGLVPREGAAAEGDRPVCANGLVSAALAEAAVSPGPAGAARGLVADERAVADEEAAEGATAGKPGTGPDRAGLALAADGA